MATASKRFPATQDRLPLFLDMEKARALAKDLRQRTRIQVGRQPDPSAGIIDSQSVKTTDLAGEKGYDGNKKIKGRRRHMIVDVMGMIIAVAVTAASVQERNQAKRMLGTIKDRMPRFKLIWADGGYTGPLIDWSSRHVDGLSR